jgi:hypothetical protein
VLIASSRCGRPSRSTHETSWPNTLRSRATPN